MIWMWTGFILLILSMLALDLGVFHRKAHVVSMKEALGWSALWIFMGLSFSIFIYFAYDNHWAGLGSRVDVIDGIMNDGHTAAIKYLTGYVIEKSLSVDNIFVIAVIFSYFTVPPHVSAPGVILGNPWCAGAARFNDWGWSQADRGISLDNLCFWRVSDLHRIQDVQF